MNYFAFFVSFFFFLVVIMTKARLIYITKTFWNSGTRITLKIKLQLGDV